MRPMTRKLAKLATLITTLGFLYSTTIVAQDKPLLPNEPIEVHAMLIKCEVEKRYGDGLKITYEALDRWPAHELLSNWKPFLLLKLGRLEEAKSEYLRLVPILKGMQQKAYALLSIAALELRSGNIDDALSFAQKAEKTKASYSNVQSMLGKVEYCRGNYKKAITHFNNAVQTNSYGDAKRQKNHRVENEYYTALCHVRLDRLGDAEAIIKDIKQDPPPTPLYFWKYYALLSNSKEASLWLDKELESDEEAARNFLVKEIKQDFYNEYKAVEKKSAWIDTLKKWGN